MVCHYVELPADALREEELIIGVYFNVHCSLQSLALEGYVHLHTTI